jgi:hypothetical protein
MLTDDKTVGIVLIGTLILMLLIIYQSLRIVQQKERPDLADVSKSSLSICIFLMTLDMVILKKYVFHKKLATLINDSL